MGKEAPHEQLNGSSLIPPLAIMIINGFTKLFSPPAMHRYVTADGQSNEKPLIWRGISKSGGKPDAVRPSHTTQKNCKHLSKKWLPIYTTVEKIVAVVTTS